MELNRIVLTHDLKWNWNSALEFNVTIFSFSARRSTSFPSAKMYWENNGGKTHFLVELFLSRYNYSPNSSQHKSFFIVLLWLWIIDFLSLCGVNGWRLLFPISIWDSRVRQLPFKIFYDYISTDKQVKHEDLLRHVFFEGWDSTLTLALFRVWPQSHLIFRICVSLGLRSCVPSKFYLRLERRERTLE